MGACGLADELSHGPRLGRIAGAIQQRENATQIRTGGKLLPFVLDPAAGAIPEAVTLRQ
jgi:hypothetical protein